MMRKYYKYEYDNDESTMFQNTVMIWVQFKNTAIMMKVLYKHEYCRNKRVLYTLYTVPSQLNPSKTESKLTLHVQHNYLVEICLMNLGKAAHPGL